MALLAMWIPILLGPVATAQVQAAEAQRVGDAAAYAAAANASAPPQSLALAELVAGWEQALRGSILGGLAAATAPTKGAEIIALTTAFAEISRDDAAMNRLREDPVMVELGELPSVQQAMDRLRHEPQVRAAIEGEAITPDRLWAILQSDEVSGVLDETGAMDDVSRRGALVAAAIARARE